MVNNSDTFGVTCLFVFTYTVRKCCFYNLPIVEHYEIDTLNLSFCDNRGYFETNGDFKKLF